MEKIEIESIEGKEIDILFDGNILDKSNKRDDDLTEWALKAMNEMFYEKAFLETLNTNAIKLHFSQVIEVEKKREILEKFLFSSIYFSNAIKIGDLSLTDHLEAYLKSKETIMETPETFTRTPETDIKKGAIDFEILNKAILESSDGDKILEEPEPTTPNTNEIKLTINDLNEDQRYIYDIITNNATKKGIHSITGSAGVGKSTLLSFIVEALYKEGTICIITPSHQALRVIRTMLENLFTSRQMENITLKTVASYLRLKYTIDENGNELFVRSEPNSFEEEVFCDYLICDESSMVAKEYAEMIMDNLDGRQPTIYKQIIWNGDEYQLKPVNGEVNPIFNPAYRREAGPINRFQLNKVTRQAEGNPIIGLAQYCRGLLEDLEQFNEHEFFNKILYSEYAQDCGIRIANSFNDFMWYYMNEDKENDPKLKRKVIANYTNISVNNYNAMIRVWLYGEQYKDEQNPYNPIILPVVIEGESVTFLKPYSGGIGTDVIFQTGDIVDITKIEEKENVAYGLRYYHCRTDTFPFNVLHPDDEPKFQLELNKLKELALSLSKNPDVRLRREAWGKYYKFMNRFANIRPTYSNTVHKLQGSTFDHCYFNLPEIRNYIRKDLDGVIRLIYVAITRGKKLTILRG